MSEDEVRQLLISASRELMLAQLQCAEAAQRLLDLHRVATEAETG